MFRFGQFELSERDGKLRKNEIRVGLQGQPFQVLPVSTSTAPLASTGNIPSPEFSRPGGGKILEEFWTAVIPFKFAGANSDLQALAESFGEEIVGERTSQ